MLATTLAVVTAAALCLVFPETRWIGVLGAALLAYVHPLSLLFVVSVAGVAAAFVFHFRRRSINEQAEQNPRSH